MLLTVTICKAPKVFKIWHTIKVGLAGWFLKRQGTQNQFGLCQPPICLGQENLTPFYKAKIDAAVRNESQDLEIVCPLFGAGEDVSGTRSVAGRLQP